MNNTYARLVIYRNVLGNKNIYDHELFGIIMQKFIIQELGM